MKTYPVFLIGLERRRCLVFGGGSEAQRKVLGLLAADADVTVISENVTGTIHELAERSILTWVPRAYLPGDLERAFLVISTGNDTATRARIFAEAEARGVLINTCDDTERCNFVAGSIHRQGDLTLAVSTAGAAPALAVRIRQKLAREFGPEYARFLELMRELRDPVATHVPDFEARRALWYALVDAALAERGDEPTTSAKSGSFV